MDSTVIGYLIFVIPGFCLVWTYRHFTKAKQIGDFEYAGWSFLWGTALFFLNAWFIKMRWISLPSTPIGDSLSFTAAMMGMGVGIALASAFPLGYLGAIFSSVGLFSYINKFLFWFVEEIDKKD